MALSNEFILSELIKSGSAALRQETTQNGTIVVNTSVNTDGSTFGYIETPKYNNEQLIKAVDTVVDELISQPDVESPAVVLKSIYDDLRIQFNQALGEIRDLKQELDIVNRENSALRSQIEQLDIEIDLEKLLRAAAENERDAVNQRLQSITLDLQSALSKGVKEAIERVSREASLQGLLAEKEAFISLQEDARSSLERANNTIDTLQKEFN